MHQVKTQSHTKGSRQIRSRPITTVDAAYQKVPFRTTRNIRRGHIANGMRMVNHIERGKWEDAVAEMQQVVEQQGLNKANRFYQALDKAHALSMAVQKREQDLQAANEEMEATNEEMEATNEELQNTTEELKLASEYGRSLIEASLDPMVAIDSDGNITDVNTETEAITGRARADLFNSDFADYTTDPHAARAAYAEALKTGEVRNVPLSVRHTDGHTTPVLYNVSVYRNSAGDIMGVLASARDITEQKHQEEKLKGLLADLKGSQAQLVQAGKMTALGTMGAGIAHELNNPMMAIINFIQYCLKHTPEDDKRYRVLKDAERESRRVSEIVGDFLSFSRMDSEGEEGYEKESLKVILNRVLKLLSYRLMKDNVSLTQHIVRGTPKVWMKTNAIQQVLINLITNALDSLDKRDQREVHIDIRRKNKGVQLAITDTGCGIAKEEIDRIFDPFFTTKPVGRGTGLGLSVSHSIVEAHGGEIRCDTDPGKGSTFTILLPIEPPKGEPSTVVPA